MGRGAVVATGGSFFYRRQPNPMATAMGTPVRG